MFPSKLGIADVLGIRDMVAYLSSSSIVVVVLGVFFVRDRSPFLLAQRLLAHERKWRINAVKIELNSPMTLVWVSDFWGFLGVYFFSPLFKKLL